MSECDAAVVADDVVTSGSRCLSISGSLKQKKTLLNFNSGLKGEKSVVTFLLI